MNINKYQLISISVFLLLFCIINVVSAAILYLEPSAGEYQAGDTFIGEIRIDTEQECINAVKADLSFSKDLLEAIDFSKGDSILTLWVENPRINQEAGLISFTGGVPGGYCGRIPGDPGISNLLGKIIFQTKELSGEQFSAEAKFLDSSRVLLNDGKGTPANLITRGAAFTILPQKPEEPLRDEWQEELAKDKIPPEPFVIEVRQDPEIFEGRYYLIFSATDKQTGLSHYEISETRDGQPEAWKAGESPYLLEDQELQSIIKVKAIDKAGNERMVEVEPIKPLIPPEEKPFPWWVIVIIVGCGAIAWVIYRFLRSGRQYI